MHLFMNVCTYVCTGGQIFDTGYLLSSDGTKFSVTNAQTYAGYVSMDIIRPYIHTSRVDPVWFLCTGCTCGRDIRGFEGGRPSCSSCGLRETRVRGSEPHDDARAELRTPKSPVELKNKWFEPFELLSNQFTSNM